MTQYCAHTYATKICSNRSGLGICSGLIGMETRW